MIRKDPLLVSYPIRIREITIFVILFLSLIFYFFPRFLEEGKVSEYSIIEEIETFDIPQTEQIKLPPPPDEGDHYDVFQNFEIEAVDRDKLKITLAEKGIGTLIQWSGKAVHHFNKLGFDQQLPRTDDLFSKMLMLPLTHMTSDEEVIYVCEKINKFYK